VKRLEEMVRPHFHLDVFGQPVVDHQRAQKRRFRLDIMGKRGRFDGLSVGKSDDVGHARQLIPKRLPLIWLAKKFRWTGCG
jgi:hypothetical protein